MKEWILIIELLSPGNDFMDKVEVQMPNQPACVKAAKNLRREPDHPLGIRYIGKCVTKAHWTGKKYMPDVPLD